MFTRIRVISVQFTQSVNFRILVIAAFSQTQNLFSLGIIKKFTILIQKLQSVPLCRIVACRQYYSSAGIFFNHGNFSSRRCGQSNVNHIKSHRHESAAYQLAYHRAGNTRITSYYDSIGAFSGVFPYKGSIRSCKSNHINGAQSFSLATSYRAAYT